MDGVFSPTQNAFLGPSALLLLEKVIWQMNTFYS